MTKSIKALLIPAALLVAPVSLHAATVVQTANYSFNNTYPSYDSTVTTDPVIPSSFFNHSFNTFNTALGTLDSVTVSWTFGGNFTATLVNGGAATTSFGGAYSFNGTTYGSAGGGGGNGGGPGTQLSVPFSLNGGSFSATLTSASPAWSAFTSGSTYLSTWDNPVTFSGTVTNLNYVANGTETITYNYTPAPEPAAATVAAMSALMLGLRRRRAGI